MEDPYNLGVSSVSHFLGCSGSSQGIFGAGNNLGCGNLFGWKSKVMTFSKNRSLGLCEFFG